ncbi:MAG: hypothetical protein A2857_02955 [Candidatus Levybacteria bacterium RIFCSPHIGHO2_01_FULL_36_15]|nr:MAG: hypothetical protein A2857_02955 [Candidatus Levybacteria bacterium RIFCSPHIGHO2_01_FULL_36_15]OGH37269.1 MAG: hypothetical protein A2905_05690 [Candidatus Levybacteria bacterium RIFCSPLOWO2_01_FULL_36_10]
MRRSVEAKPSLILIHGEDKPEKPPFLEFPNARYERRREERKQLESCAATPEDRKDIGRMNCLRASKEPSSDREAYVNWTLSSGRFEEDP